METKKEQVAVWVTEKVHKGFDTVIKYVANDGKKFDSERECLSHEWCLKTIEETKGIFAEPPFFSSEQMRCLLCLLFSVDDASDIQILIFSYNDTDEILDKMDSYFSAIGFNHPLDSEYRNCIVGEKYLIASWHSYKRIGDTYNDGRIILLSDAIGALDSLKNALNQTT